MPDTLRDKLKSLGVTLGVSNLKPPVQETMKRRIEDVVEGEDIHTVFGDAFVTHSDYPADYQHGVVRFDRDSKLDLLGQWGKIGDLQKIRKGEILFLDTETSGLAGGAGTFAFMVGVGYFHDQGFQVRQFFMRDPSEELPFLTALMEFLTPFTTIVTFNGKAFDIPLMNTRFILSSLGSPFEGMPHIDLLHLARRLWRNRLERRTLGDLEREIMVYTRSQEEVPGWLIPQIYFDYLRSGDAQPLAGVFYHNSIDILSLAALFVHVNGLLADPLADPAVNSLDLAAIAHLYQELGKLDEAATIYEKSIEQGLPRAFFLDTLHLFGMLHRKRGEMDAAVRAWERAANEGRLDSCVELAKYYEHTRRDYVLAGEWTERALLLIPGNAPGDPAKLDLEHRLTRIRIKLEKIKEATGNES